MAKAWAWGIGGVAQISRKWGAEFTPNALEGFRLPHQSISPELSGDLLWLSFVRCCTTTHKRRQKLYLQVSACHCQGFGHPKGLKTDGFGQAACAETSRANAQNDTSQVVAGHQNHQKASKITFCTKSWLGAGLGPGPKLSF